MLALASAAGEALGALQYFGAPGLVSDHGRYTADMSLPPLARVSQFIGLDALGRLTGDLAASAIPGAASGSAQPPAAVPDATPSPSPSPTPGLHLFGGSGQVVGYAGLAQNAVDSPVVQVGSCGAPGPGLTGGAACPPLAGVEVTLRSAGGTLVGSAVSAADGSFSIPGTKANSIYSLHCSKDGYGSPGSSDVKTDGKGNAGSDQATCLLSPSGHVTGMVSDAVTGQALADAKVVLYEDNDTAKANPVGMALSGLDGSYSVPHAAPDHQYLLEVTKTGYVTFDIEVQTDAQGNASQACRLVRPS